MKNILLPQTSARFRDFVTTLTQKSQSLLARGIAPSVQLSKRILLSAALKAFAILLIATLSLARSNAQLPCNGVDVGCVLSPTLPYKCITGPTTFQDQIDQGNLALANQSANAVQRIVINGYVTVELDSPDKEYTFPTGSEIVFATSNSQLVIMGGNTLRLTGVKIYGCHEESIFGIRAMANSTLVAEGCEFADAVLNIRPSSTISIVGNTFRRSLSQMRIESGTGTVNFTAGGSISGNKFFGDEFLKPPNAGMKPVNGIVILNDITIGKSNGAKNEFHNFGNGVNYEGSAIYISAYNAAILNTTFDGIAMGSTLETNAAIFASAGSKVSVQGLGSGESAPNTFHDCRSGVYLEHASVDISNAKFTNVETGVHHIQSSTVFPSQSLKINSCRFEGFLRRGVKVEGSPFLNLNTLEIQNCVFDDNSIIPAIRGGVYIGSANPASGKFVIIKNNKVYFRDRNSGGSLFTMIGFYVFGIQKGRGENNEFYDQGNEDMVGAGVRMEGCDGFVWFNNDVIGNNSAGFGDKGFIVYNSPNCVYSCNYLSGTKYGMWFDGLCNASNLYQNSFNDHNEYGLYLQEEGTVIGGQFKKYNTWGGSTGDAETYMTFSNYDPNDPMDKFQVRKSLFTTQTSNQNNDYWATPRLVGNVMGDDPNWFESNEPTPYTIDLCPAVTIDPNDPKLDFGEKGIVNGTFVPWKGYAANTWDAAFLLYQRMTEDTTLRPSGSPEATWYANNYNGNLGKFCRVFDGLVSLSSDTPTATAAQLFSNLNAISVTTTYEQNLKTDLCIFLGQYLANGSALTQQQVADLTAIANQCRYEGGRGVVLARLALGQSSTRDGDCSTSFRGGGGSERSNPEFMHSVSATVFPNPAEHSFSVQLDHSLQNATARLVDLQGRLLGTWAFSGNILNVSEVSVSAGVYFLEVLEQGHVLIRNKIVFNH
ncbi:MAG: T9SS type A sorting domain-containing protein [Saprospiraceae bacterium]